MRGHSACSRFLRPVIGMLDGGWGLLDESWEQSFGEFIPGTRTVTLG